jgi:hypothetical protein
MSIDDLIGEVMGDPPSGGAPGQSAGPDPATLLGALLGGGSGVSNLAGQAAGAGGLDLTGLLGALLSGDGEAPTGSAFMAGLLSALGGASSAETGQPALDVNGLAEGTGVAPSVIQAAIPLVLGGLLQGSLSGRAGGAPLDETRLQATGIPQELSAKTGIDLSKAVLIIQQLIEALRKALKPPSASGAAKPARKRKRPSQSSASHAAAARPKRPKSSAGASSSKPRPKAKPKPKSAAKPKRPRKKTSTRAPEA